ncbi:hypothetical protein B0H11DRAFT_1934685 [Mycena galericulata]|nr:hypothetical protein B0H11DRAFT_1934685 [Mycena galericulata]
MSQRGSQQTSEPNTTKPCYALPTQPHRPWARTPRNEATRNPHSPDEACFVLRIPALQQRRAGHRHMDASRPEAKRAPHAMPSERYGDEYRREEWEWDSSTPTISDLDSGTQRR